MTERNFIGFAEFGFIFVWLEWDLLGFMEIEKNVCWNRRGRNCLVWIRSKNDQIWCRLWIYLLDCAIFMVNGPEILHRKLHLI